MGDAETGRAQDGVSISTIGGLIYVSWTVIFVSLIILLYLLQLSSGCGCVSARAGNEPSRSLKFHNHKEGLLVEAFSLIVKLQGSFPALCVPVCQPPLPVFGTLHDTLNIYILEIKLNKIRWEDHIFRL